MTDAELRQRILDALASAGLALKGEPDYSGEMAYCGTDKAPNGTDGRYVVHLDFPPNVWVLNRHTDGETGRVVHLWRREDLDAMTEEDRAALRERVRQGREEAARKMEERRERAASTAARLWKRAATVTGMEHLYLQKKDVPSHGLKLLSNGVLIVPVLDTGGTLHSLQCITPDGGKRFLKGGNVAGCFFPIPAKDGGKTGPLLIAEGYATGASLHRATGHAVLVAFNAGNLLPVAQAARAVYPEREIILCADNDVETKKPDGTPWNPGIEAATAAAQAVGGKLAVCPAHEGRPTDFNDLAAWRSLEAVRLGVEAAREASAVRLPDGFFIRESGRNPGLFKRETKGEESFDLRIGPPLRIIGKTSDDGSDNWGTFLSWKDPAGVDHRWALPDDLLQGQGREYAQILARGGYSIAPGQAAKFAAFIQGVKTSRFVTCVPRIGWCKGAYVMPDLAYGIPEDTVVLQSARHAGMFRAGGTLEGWKEIPSLCAGNSRLVFALCAAFAGPLLRVSGIEGGGFSFEGGSSSGKTTALQVAASVWGGPEHVRSWRITDNALEGVAALHNDNVLILDEVGQVSSAVLSDSAYMLANGQAKGRAGREGNMRRVLTWQLLFLSSGELGLADKLAENGLKSRGGQEVRFVGLPVDKGMMTAFHGLPDAGAVADRIKELCAGHYGRAGREFLQWLCPRRAEVGRDIQDHLPRLVDELCPGEATEQVRRVAKRFCLVLGAGIAAQNAGLLPPDMEIMAHVRSCFNDWLAARGGPGASEDAAILSAVRLFIEQHGASRFQDIGNPGATCINRVGFRRQVDSETEFIVLPESFRKEVIKGHAPRRAGEVLRAAGWLRQGDGKSTTKRDLPGMGRVRAYVLTVPRDSQADADAP